MKLFPKQTTQMTPAHIAEIRNFIKREDIMVVAVDVPRGLGNIVIGKCFFGRHIYIRVSCVFNQFREKQMKVTHNK